MMFVSQMDEIDFYTDDSSESVEEVESPRKPPPPLIDLTSNDKFSNLNSGTINVQNFSSSSAAEPVVNDPVSETNNGHNPIHWTDDMIQFYNEDWGGEEQFNVEEIQASMDKDPSLWEISPKDYLYKKNRRSRSYVKCTNCCQFGHSIFECKEGLQIPKCFMCGGAGHEEITCPRAICLTCGNQTTVYVVSCYKCIPETKYTCTSCYLHGHHFINCSDNWRRFHATIGKTAVESPQNRVYKLPKDLWCCNCAKKGHNQINCRTRDRRVFPDTFPYVVTYDTPFKQNIYSETWPEPVAGPSTSWGRGFEHQIFGGKLPDNKFAGNFRKSSRKRRKRRKKKNSKALIRMLGFIHCE